jgi:predicted alpha/beta superfamily hydrolase
MKYLSTLLLFNIWLSIPAQIPHVNSGTIRRFEKFQSKYVQPRNIDVWLPDNYSSAKKYAVLYMHDGQMLFDSAITWNHQAWNVSETVTRLLQQNRIRDCIVVGIWNNGDYRHAEYFPQKALGYLPTELKDQVINDDLKRKPLADNYLLFITKELKPFIDSTFSTYRDTANTFIAGSSMGGLISLYAVCECPDVFGGAICMSTHWVGSSNHQNYRAFSHAFCAYLADHLPDSKNHKIYFDHGDKTLDSLYWPYQMAIDKVMEAKEYSYSNWMSLHFVGDDHSEKSWGRGLEGR